MAIHDYPVGTRVAAVAHSDNESIHLFGFGTYDGDHIPPEDVFFMGAPRFPHPNPKITLDGGKVVWGCECWWGPEEDFKDSIQGRKVIEVDIIEARAESKRPASAA